ncbi:NAD(P)H-dependent oxidoreductase [Rhizobium ruizarguesonis]|uniref:NAD(P)H-dependent oxidoreductase n=1 Tax=Rhizobium ruizarguesonis TaxID=2081791 RepID=UPI0010317ABF|nr:NAD(P)H-dependent oxidoreductase [Rhizobium ruizarguesonis]TAY84748.1 hypothetical protein ELH85_32345 [Rhizobium ruizarguesonis]
MSTQLKAWADRVLVAEQTDKKVFIGSARGGVYSGKSPTAELDHQESHLSAALNLIGLTDISVVRAEGLGARRPALPS